MAQNNVIEFPFLCCWCCLLALIFTAGHVNSAAGGQHDRQPDPDGPSASPTASSSNTAHHQKPPPLTREEFSLNGQRPAYPNIYPLSEQQLNANKFDQAIMAKLIEDQKGTSTAGIGFDPELQKIVQKLDKDLSEHGVHLYSQYLTKSWPQLLSGWMEDAIKNTEADNTDLLFEILVTTTNEQKEQMGLYSSDICDRMLKHPVMNRTENRGYKTLMRQLCKEKRDGSHDKSKLRDAPSDIFNAIEKYLQKEAKRKRYMIPKNQEAEEIIGRWFAETNYTEMRCALINMHFGTKTVFDWLEKLMMNDEKNKKKLILQAIYAIHMDAVQGRPELLYHLFEKIWKKQKKDKDLNAFIRDFGRLLITHAQIDLVDIGSTKLNKLKDWLTSAMALYLNGNLISTEQRKQLTAFIQIVDLVEDENWKNHFKKND